MVRGRDRPAQMSCAALNQATILSEAGMVLDDSRRYASTLGNHARPRIHRRNADRTEQVDDGLAGGGFKSPQARGLPDVRRSPGISMNSLRTRLTTA